ncbi:MAG: ROK family protein [Pseudomonadota bacterium]
MSGPVLIAIETGGTKIVCRMVSVDSAPLGQFQLPTSEPRAAIDTLAQRAAEIAPKASVAGVGVASFGPVDVEPSSPTYGRVLETTKPGWTGFDLGGALGRVFGAPVAIDTDVNAAALAETMLGAAKGLHTVAYVTVGTGIGGGLVVGGRTLRGALHPEIGHLPLRRKPGDDWPSFCPFHQNCAEGLAAGPAVAAKLAGRVLNEASDVEVLVVDYLGQLCAQLVLAWSPQRIVMGGGVLTGGRLLAQVEARMRTELNGYGAARVAHEPGYLVTPALEHAGLEGAVILARRAAGGPQRSEDSIRQIET